ncbi:Ku protein [Tabrizicola sp. BL-A-41-H6]|uniref:non-homologous end joining protein Ku n=1 Tax=Tabrizicola sp. BL-A-41-H6 TaxID=3421107 RepID=UPI003D67A95B
MAPRSFWKGYLKLSLVTCPVTMMPATTETEKLRFHTMNAKTGNRVVSHYVDSVTGKPLRDGDEVKGYPRGEDDFVLLDDDEIDSVALESTRTIEIEMFVPADSVGWIWYDKPHYLLPNDKVGEEAFSVIREAMQATGTVGISRVVLYRRERAVMLEPRGKGIVLWTLRYGDEVRREDEKFASVEDAKPEPDVMKLVTTLIKERTGPWEPSMAEDPVQAKLIDIIAAKKKGRKRPARSEMPTPDKSNVVSITDALKRSLAAEKKGKS